MCAGWRGRTHASLRDAVDRRGMLILAARAAEQATELQRLPRSDLRGNSLSHPNPVDVQEGHTDDTASRAVVEFDRGFEQ